MKLTVEDIHILARHVIDNLRISATLHRSIKILKIINSRRLIASFQGYIFSKTGALDQIFHICPYQSLIHLRAPINKTSRCTVQSLQTVDPNPLWLLIFQQLCILGSISVTSRIKKTFCQIQKVILIYSPKNVILICVCPHVMKFPIGSKPFFVSKKFKYKLEE